MKVMRCWTRVFVIKDCFVLNIALYANIFIIDFHDFYQFILITLVDLEIFFVILIINFSL